MKKRPPFYKLGYNPNHIPHQGSYEKNRKKRLEAWDKPELNWPPKLPRATKNTGRTLLKELDREEKLKIKKERVWDIPDYRTGDVV